jgi:hypothetical protein
LELITATARAFPGYNKRNTKFFQMNACSRPTPLASATDEPRANRIPFRM